MANMDRRQLFALGGLSAGALTLTLVGCAPSSSKLSDAGPSAKGTIAWWDQFQPLQKLEQSTFDAFSKAHPEITVKYTVYDPNNLQPALQLAQKSNQLPDVFSNGFGVPDPVLVQNKWVTPIDLTAASKSALGAQALLDGLHVFNGKVYTFPLFSFRQHSTLNYFSKSAVQKAGGDPTAGPKSWADFRTLARAITKNGGGQMYGWIEGLTLTARMSARIVDLASGAGAQLSQVQNSAAPAGVADATTGDYAFASSPFLEAFDFLRSLVQDKVMFPSSTSLDVRTARARWAAGAGGMFLDGSWNVGVLQSQFQTFLSDVGVANMPTPDGNVHISNGPTGGVFWVSSKSAFSAAASEILNQFTTPEYAAGLARNMDQPPADLASVKEADVPAVYKDAVSLMANSVALAPSAIVKNPNVATVLAEMQDIRPNLGEIVQGYLGGNISNIKDALTTYQSKLSSERDKAIKAVNGRGIKTDLSDWQFANVERGVDYDSSKYGK